jgi:plasmid stability protein
MATIQIRDIPEDAYAVIRGRARADGRSLQSYLRDHLIDLARHPSAGEALLTLDAVLAAHDTPGATHESILTDLAADRR